MVFRAAAHDSSWRGVSIFPLEDAGAPSEKREIPIAPRAVAGRRDCRRRPGRPARDRDVLRRHGAAQHTPIRGHGEVHGHARIVQLHGIRTYAPDDGGDRLRRAEHEHDERHAVPAERARAPHHLLHERDGRIHDRQCTRDTGEVHRLGAADLSAQPLAHSQ